MKGPQSLPPPWRVWVPGEPQWLWGKEVGAGLRPRALSLVLIPAPRSSRYPQVHSPSHLPGALALLGSSVRKALVWPHWVHCPHPWSPESLLPQLAALCPDLGHSPAPSSSASRAGSNSKSSMVDPWRCMVGRPDQGPWRCVAGVAAPYNPHLPSPVE